MEHFAHIGPQQRNSDEQAYELEERLAAAERRYAYARARSVKARDECLALESEPGTRPDVIRRARERYATAEAHCKNLKRLIEDLEAALD